SLIPGLSQLVAASPFLITTVIVLNALANLSLAHWIALRRATSYGKIQITRIVVFVGSAIAFVELRADASSILYAYLAGCVVVVAWLLSSEWRPWQAQPSLSSARKLYSYGWPLMLNATSAIVVAYLSRLILDRYSDLATVGVYGLFLMLTLQLNGLW